MTCVGRSNLSKHALDTADLEGLVKQKQVGQQGAQMDRRVEVVDDLRADPAPRQNETHRGAGTRRIGADDVEKSLVGLVARGSAGRLGRRRSDDPERRLGALEIAADTFVVLVAA